MKTVRCGNCRKTYEVPDEQPGRYHAIQAHKRICPEGDPEAVADQHEQLVREFEAQKKAAVRAPWWKFWRRS